MVRPRPHFGDPCYPHALRVVHRICGYPRSRCGRVAGHRYDVASLSRTCPMGSATVSSNAERLDDLERMRARSRAGGGAARVEKQHAAGKLTARERLDLLLDPG